MTITESMSNIGAGIRYEEIPNNVKDRVKYLALDFIGLAARGSVFGSTKPVYEFVREYGTGKGTIIGKEDAHTLPQYAALANGVSSHSLELDDVCNEASLHPAVVIFPAALAKGEELQNSGKELIESIIFGYEVMVRLGKALKPSNHYSRGFHPTGTCGVFGAAATVSKMNSLSNEQTKNAFGIVGSQAAGSMEFLSTGAWTKRLHPGWAAHTGIIAGELARRGFTGPETIIEGEKGFANSYSYNSDLSNLEGELSYGSELAVLKASIKPHACCRYKQGPLDIILSIIKTNDILPEDIEKINVYLVKTALPIISVPEEIKRNPKTSVDAQFSMNFGAAVAALYRKTLLEEYDDSTVELPEVKEMMKKVFCFHDPELDKDFPEKWPARVEIQTSQKKYVESIDYPKGDPENPLTWDELIEKFKYVTGPIYSADKQKQIISAVRNLESYDNLAEFTELL